MTAKGTPASGSGRGSAAWNRAKAGGQPPGSGVRGFPPPPPRYVEPAPGTEYGEPSIRHNRAIDAEIESLRAERARLILQCETAGVDTTIPELPVIRALHPREVVLPTILLECASCVDSRRAVREAEAARARTEHKYQMMHVRYLEMIRTQEAMRGKIDSLQLSLARAHDRMERAGVPLKGPVHAPKRGTEDRT